MVSGNISMSVNICGGTNLVSGKISMPVNIWNGAHLFAGKISMSVIIWDGALTVVHDLVFSFDQMRNGLTLV